MNDMYPILIPMHTSQPEKTKCPKCGHQWVEESDDLPLSIMALFVFLVLFLIGALAWVALDTLDFIPEFSKWPGRVAGWSMLIALGVTVICGIVDLIRYRNER